MANTAFTGPELLELMRQQAVNFGTRIITEDIKRVDFSKRPFRLDASDGKTYEAQAVIVATGARANYLGLPSEDQFKNHGVCGCAVCDGALPRFRNKPLVVIGGGDSAVEEATYLTKFASKVYLVHRRDKLRASKIMAERAAANPKIEIIWNRTVDEVLGNDQDGVTGVRLKSTVGEAGRIAHRRLLPGIGHTPNTAFLQAQLELTDKRLRRLDHAHADLYQRARRVRRRRRGRRLLSPGRHRRGHGLHGGAGCGTLAGGTRHVNGIIERYGNQLHRSRFDDSLENRRSHPRRG